MADIQSSDNRIAITEDENLDLDALLVQDSISTEQALGGDHEPPPSYFPDHKSSAVISASEGDGTKGNDHWILPAPAAPGDYLSTSLRRVPSKSILKKTSSIESIGSIGMETSQSKSLPGRKSSFLSFPQGTPDTSANSQPKRDSSHRCESPEAIGWDLDDSSLSQNKAVAHPQRGSFHSADRGAGSFSADSSAHSGKLSAASAPAPKMRRNVSFSSVAIREYDRTIGDHPGCKSGPPLSLDWSYSKKEEKPLDEYELERAFSRVGQTRKFHVNKWKRRNMLSFHWGHTEEEMKAARRETKKTQRRRSITMALLPFHLVQEGCMSLKSKFSKKRDDDCLTENSTLDGSSDKCCPVQHVCVPSSFHVESEGLPSSFHTV